MQEINIEGRTIGDSGSCFIIAEVGVNHNGDLSTAKKLIEAASDSGADAVKFQNYKTEEVVSDPEATYEYKTQGEWIEESQWEMFKRYELPTEWLPELQEHADENNIIFFCTPMSREGLNELLELGVPLLKNGSDCLTQLDLVEAMGEVKVPTIMSTGMATLSEIDEAVRTYYNSGGEKLALLHCVSLYPTPHEEVNLKKIESLRNLYDIPIGFSDHSKGIEAALASVALGGNVIEKHFTLDKTMRGPDHQLSMDPTELEKLAESVDKIEDSLGKPYLTPSETEWERRKDFKLSCVASRELSKGEQIGDDDVIYQRPGTGYPPKFKEFLVGLTLQKPIEQGKPFTKDYFVGDPGS